MQHVLLATTAIYKMNYLQAIVIGVIQGVFELFPLSSLGHTVLIPSWIGGTWATLVRQESSSESPYLAFIVGLHLANAVALLLFYAREWYRLIYGWFRTLAHRRIETDAERLAWLIVIATIPVGILGLLFEHEFRVLFAKPLACAIFLLCNGLILATGEWYRRYRLAAGPSPDAAVAAPLAGAGSAAGPGGRVATSLASSYPPAGTGPGSGGEARVTARGSASASLTRAARRFRDENIVTIDVEAEHQLSRVGFVSAFWIGAAQALALLAGISREGVAMVGGLFRGLGNENAMRGGTRHPSGGTRERRACEAPAG
jgi:undecaprenyl-diphosphatase